jgi:hypothetical protein
MKHLVDAYIVQSKKLEEEQTKQWPKEKFTKGHTTIYKTYT